jgi:hypothetical protein
VYMNSNMLPAPPIAAMHLLSETFSSYVFVF